jgi:hypothetical protein
MSRQSISARGLARGLAFMLAMAGALPGLYSSLARAEGCYTCGGGSSDHCRDYCHYHGQDTFAARRECEKKGCKVSGAAACPQPGPNKAICLAPPPANTPGGDSHLVATVPWCAAPAHSEDSRL